MPRGIAKDHDAKRAALRRGAAAYFSAHGFDRASMTGAAQHCGVSKATIYHYYESKEALLYDILAAHFDRLVAAADPHAGDLRGFVHAILMAYADADAEHKLQVDALGLLPHDLQKPLKDQQRYLVRLMCDTLQAAAPELEGDRLHAAAMSGFGVLNWYYMWYRAGRGLTREEFAELAADFIIGGARAV
jgi:AcrR family transcriptional regulator